MVLNALKNGAKRMMKSIKIRCNGINTTLSNHYIHGSEGQNNHERVGLWVLKAGNWA